MGFCENLDRAGQQKEINTILFDNKSPEINERQMGESLVETLDVAREFLFGEFVEKFIAEDIEFNKEERKHLSDKLDIIKEKIEIEFASDRSLTNCKYGNLQHIIKNFFMTMLCRADKYERIVKKGTDIFGTDFYRNYKKTLPFFESALPYFDYYVTDLAENDSVFDIEVRRRDGYLEKYEVYRYKDFSRDKKYNIASTDDYLRLFYLFRKLETGGISREEYIKLRADIENPKSELSEKARPKVFDFDELEENFIYDKSGENILGVIERK